ncbi:MAG: hypothetical protein QXS20_05385 [Candidatus Thorarchaeota archaeon]
MYIVLGLANLILQMGHYLLGMSEDRLTDSEKQAIEEGLRRALLSDSDLVAIAQGDDPARSRPVISDDDIVSAAASALEFVEKLEPPGREAEAAMAERDAVSGFDALLKKLETLRSDISSLQRGVVSVFAAQLLAFRGKVVELKSRISAQMVEKLRMQFFKSVIENTFVEIVDSEFSKMEKELINKIVEQTQERFQEFATKVRESEDDLRTTIVEQQDIVREFMKSLENDALAVREELREKERQVQALEAEVRKLQARIDIETAGGVASSELSRRLGEIEAEADRLRRELLERDALAAKKDEQIQQQANTITELKARLAEVEGQLRVYASERAAPRAVSARSEAEFTALAHKVELLEASLAEKRKEIETNASIIQELERNLKTAVEAKNAAESLAQKRLAELQSLQTRLGSVKDLEERIYQLEKELAESQKKADMLRMQQEAFEKATRLMERERDMALEMRDYANERAARYIRVLNVDASTKVLLLVDEVGSMTFADLAKALAIQVPIAAKHARQLEKLGVLKIEGERVYSTLTRPEIGEGEVKV